VGVDVPNATVMVILGSRRFGLSQLHQLRGRVGRGGERSYCLLVVDGEEEAALERLALFARTTDGFELTWQVNYLAPYLLTNLLRQTLLDSRASVVGTSSIASVLFSRFDPTDPETFDAFSPNRAYGNAKLATNWFAKALHDRFHDRGLSTVAFHPGVIATNFGAESSGILHHAYNLAGDRMFTPAEQGGMNLAYFLTGVPGIHWESGEYYNDKRRPGIQRRAARDRDLIDSVFTETAEVLGVQW